MPSSSLVPDKNQAISFKAIKACYPFTIKGWLFSLLCYQPQAVPTYLKTLTPSLAQRCQYLPLIWNGQAKAQPPNRFILSLTSSVYNTTRRSYRGPKLSRATPIRSVCQGIYIVNIASSFYWWVKIKSTNLSRDTGINYNQIKLINKDKSNGKLNWIKLYFCLIFNQDNSLIFCLIIYSAILASFWEWTSVLKAIIALATSLLQ